MAILILFLATTLNAAVKIAEVEKEPTPVPGGRVEYVTAKAVWRCYDATGKLTGVYILRHESSPAPTPAPNVRIRAVPTSPPTRSGAVITPDGKPSGETISVAAPVGSTPARGILKEDKDAEAERRADEKKRIEAGRVEQEWAVIDVQVKQVERTTLEIADTFERFSQQRIIRGEMHLDTKPEFSLTARDRFRANGGETYDQYIFREAARRGLTESHMRITAEVEHARKNVRELIDWACWHPLLHEPCKRLRELHSDSEDWRLPS